MRLPWANLCAAMEQQLNKTYRRALGAEKNTRRTASEDAFLNCFVLITCNPVYNVVVDYILKTCKSIWSGVFFTMFII